MDRPREAVIFSALTIAIIALPLFRLFPPTRVAAALGVWIICAGGVATVMSIRFRQPPAYAIAGTLLGVVLTIALVGAAGLRRVELRPGEVQGFFATSAGGSLSANTKVEIKESLFHSEIDPGAHWSYRALYLKVQGQHDTQYFYVFQQSADQTLPDEVTPVSYWLWLFAI
jgi:hypothetical protein